MRELGLLGKVPLNDGGQRRGEKGVLICSDGRAIVEDTLQTIQTFGSDMRGGWRLSRVRWHS